MLFKVKMPRTELDRNITPMSIHTLFKALSGHFRGNYDALKYNWKAPVSNNEFEKNRTKPFFERLSRRFKLNEIVLIFISNLVSNPNTWIGDIINADAIEFYRRYIIKINNVENIYREDIKNIYYFSKQVEVKALKEIFDYNVQHQTSYIFKLLQSNIISYETFMMLDSFMNIIDKHDEIAKDIVWRNDYSIRLKAYRELIEIDSAKSVKIFKEVILDYRDLIG